MITQIESIIICSGRLGPFRKILSDYFSSFIICVFRKHSKFQKHLTQGQMATFVHLCDLGTHQDD